VRTVERRRDRDRTGPDARVFVSRPTLAGAPIARS
jgi:hypothetical protein